VNIIADKTANIWNIGILQDITDDNLPDQVRYTLKCIISGVLMVILSTGAGCAAYERVALATGVIAVDLCCVLQLEDHSCIILPMGVFSIGGIVEKVLHFLAQEFVACCII